MTTRICIKCGKEKELELFVKNNRHKSGYYNYCKECYNTNKRSDYHREWERNNYIKNIDKLREKYKRLHPKGNIKDKIRSRKYYWKNRNICLKRHKEWNKQNPDKVLLNAKKNVAKRKRNFGYIPLNDKFPGSVGHHISKDLVIHIPEKLHKSIPHRYDDPISMGEINGLALEFMMPEVG